MTSLYVTNHGDTILTDSWDGKPYVIEPGKTVEVPVHFAVNVLGHEAPNKAPYLARLGWAATLNDIPEGLEKLSKFEITTEPPKVKNHSLPPVVERVPLPTAKKAGGKVLKAA